MKPKVSIGLPVYNGEKFIEEALNAVLGQTFNDFELIICDNASTDATAEIAEKYAAKDQRIQFVRNSKNLGAAKNFNRVLELAQGEYFKWVAHDDLMKPTFLAECVKQLDEDPTIVLSCPKVSIVDEKGSFIKSYHQSLGSLDSKQIENRFANMIFELRSCFPFYGLIRRNALKSTGGLGGFPGADRVLLANLSLLGRLGEVPDHLLLIREHDQRFIKVIRDKRLRAGWFDSSKEGSITLPTWKFIEEYGRVINRAPIGWKNKIFCYSLLAKWVTKKLKPMRNDLIFYLRNLRHSQHTYGKAQ